MNIILIGLMGSGKSSVGRILATALDRPFVDTDALVEIRAGRPIPEIFRTDGEAAFRQLEQEAIAAATATADQVLATGGGAVLNPANRHRLRESGRVFWLDAPPEELLLRAVAQGIAGRPLLSGPDPLQRLQDLARERADAYRQAAHHRVETSGRSPEAVAQMILRVLKETI